MNRVSDTNFNRTFELKHIINELPEAISATVVGNSLVMDLAQAKEIFGIDFKKRICESLLRR